MKNIRGMGLLLVLGLLLVICGGIAFAVDGVKNTTASATPAAHLTPTPMPTYRPAPQPTQPAQPITVRYHSTQVGKIFLTYHDSYVVVKFSGISGNKKFMPGFENGVAGISFDVPSQGGHYHVDLAVHQDKSPPSIQVVWCAQNDFFCQS